MGQPSTMGWAFPNKWSHPYLGPDFGAHVLEFPSGYEKHNYLMVRYGVENFGLCRGVTSVAIMTCHAIVWLSLYCTNNICMGYLFRVRKVFTDFLQVIL